MVRKLVFLGVGAISLALAQPAAATTEIFDLNTADPASGLGSGPFGTVTVDDTGGELAITLQLLDGFRINQSNNANHHALSFSILGDPSLTISNLTSGFSVVGASSGTDSNSPPLGSFFTALDCTICGPGYGGAYDGPLSFTVSASTPLSLSSLGFNTYNGSDIYFGSDVINAAGNTGNVGGVMSAVPEPATWAMLLIGFAAVGFAMRRRGSRARVRVNYA